MNHRIPAVMAAAVLCCGASGSIAAARAASLSDPDRTFLATTAQGALYELAVAGLAPSRTARPDIKDYARTMAADHTHLNSELHRLAQRDHVPLPTTMTPDKQKTYDELRDLNGKDFDDRFLASEAGDNRDDVSDEVREVGTTGDPEVKALAQRFEEADSRHLKLGRALQATSQ